MCINNAMEKFKKRSSPPRSYPAASGLHAVQDNVRPSMGAEDFSYMLERVPGAMVWLGNGGGADAVSLHNSRYDFNDMAIPFGVSFFVRTVERFLGDQQAS